MFLRTAKRFEATALFLLSACLLAQAACPIEQIVVKGRVDDPPSNPKILVQLAYERSMSGESADITPESVQFTLSVDFLTQSRKPIFNSAFEKCDRRPRGVIVTLLDREQDIEYDRLSFDFPKDFNRIGQHTYVLKSQALLKGRR